MLLGTVTALVTSCGIVQNVASAETSPLDPVFEKLPPPATEFIRSIEEIDTTIEEKGRNWGRELRRVRFEDILEFIKQIKEWFSAASDTIFAFIKATGNLIVWILTSIAEVLKWLLSFIR